MKKALLFSLAFLMLLANLSFAQSRTITGVVTEKDGGPIPGVSVSITGTNVGTQTDGNGKFTIHASPNQSLKFSFIGYVSQTISIGNRTNFNIVLVSDAKQLGEVVVTGVGVATTKTKVPIDVKTVSSKDFGKGADLSVSQALVGQIAGAQVIQQSGKPGSGTQIILRGYTNLGSSNPLVMVDGIQVGTDVLDILDPAIVDHIEVVEGSAGGMLYGSQGGNGVIQVFTKKGTKDGKLAIDFSSKASVDKVIAKNPLVAQFHHYDTDASGNILDANGNPIKMDSHGVWTSPQEEAYSTDKTVQNNKPYNLPTYDHIAQGYRTAYTYNNNLTIRGGNEKNDYLFSVSNLAQQDVFSNNYNRTNVAINLGFTLAKGLTFRNNADFVYTHETLLNGSRFNLVNSYPYINFKYIDPSTGLYTVKPSADIDGNNSLTEKDYHQRYSNTPRIIENADLNYKFPKFVELDAKYGIDYRNVDFYDYYANQENNPQGVAWGNPAGQITDQYYNDRQFYGNTSVFVRFNFKNDFHSRLPITTATQFSYDFKQEGYRYYYAQGSGLPPYPPYDINGANSKTAGDGSDFHTLFYGILVNQTIDWGNLFGISGGFRSDYSSQFGGQSKPFTFPRGTIYFNPSELFSNHNLVTNWKLRGAYGEAGVQPGIYDRQLTLSPGNLGPSGTTLSNSTVSANPLLAIQVTKELEIGSDLTVTPFTGNWLSRITLSGSYWDKKSDDVEQTAKVAPSSGFLGVKDNLISLKGHGYDLSLDATTYKSENFTWNVGWRFSVARTYVTKLSNGQPIFSGAFGLHNGDQIGTLFGQTPLHSIDQLKPDGTRYISAANASNYTIVNGNVVDTRNYRAVLTASNDLSNMGNVNPDFTTSLFNRFTIFRKLSVAFQFDWFHGNKIYNQTNQWLYRDRLSKDFDKPVTIAGQTGAFVNYYDSYYNTLNPVSWFVENGSFIRLRDASISYDLTSTVNQKWLKSLVIGVAGHNLLTFTKYKGLDPEANAALDNQGNGLSNIGSYRGIDDYAQPNIRSYQFNIHVGF